MNKKFQTNTNNNLIVISLGGSLIVPDDIDIKFLKAFKNFIIKQIKLGRKFILVCGGGKITRKYLKALSDLSKTSHFAQDELGITITVVNANLIQKMFGSLAYKKVVQDPKFKVNKNSAITVAAGYKPGRSTDDIAVHLAKINNAAMVINLSNIDFVYDKDPRKYKSAKPIEFFSWKEYLTKFVRKWSPGANVPFDPEASVYASRNNIKVAIASGYDLKNLNLIISGKKSKGTLIS